MAITQVTEELIKDGAITSAKLDTNIAITGDLTVDTNTLFVDSSTNRVGIGTTNPTSILQINTSSAGQDPLFAYNSSGINTFQLGHLGSDDPYFAMKDNSNVQQVMFRLDGGSSYINTGNVGIGTTSPNAKLDVVGTAKIGPNRQAIFSESNGNNSSIIFSSSGNMEFRGTETDYKQLFLKSGGNVGIGTTSPNEKLHVNGGTTNVVANFESTDAKAYISFKDSSTTNTDTVFLGAEGNNMTFYAGSASAERMRIDSSGRVGIGESNPSRLLHLSQSGGGAVINIKRTNDASSGSAFGAMQFLNSNGYTVASTYAIADTDNLGAAITFNTTNAASSENPYYGATERMRIDSSGVVQVRNTAPNLTLYNTDTNLEANQTIGNINFESTETSVGSSGVLGRIRCLSEDVSPDSSLIFYTHSNISGTGTLNERMRINSSGHIGMGTNNPATNVHIKDSNASQLWLDSSATSDQQNRIASLRSSGGAYSSLLIDANTHIFRTGTTERMRIESGGDVKIGSNNDPKLYMTSTGGNGNNQRFYIDGFADGGGAGYGGGFRIHTRDTVNVWHERMRITSGGNVGIGTDSPSAKLVITAPSLNTFLSNITSTTSANIHQIKNNNSKGIETVIYSSSYSGGTYLSVGANGSAITGNSKTAITTVGAFDLLFGTNNSERMRITSGGFLKASNTGGYVDVSSVRHEFINNQGGNLTTMFAHSHSTNPYGNQIFFTAAAPNNTTNYFILGKDNVANRFIVYSNGNVGNTNNSYGAISDIKLKENITDASPKLDDLMQVKIRNYNLIGEETKQIGVVAQELEEVFPAMVSESPDFENQEVPQLDENGQEVLDENGDVIMTTEKVDLGTTTKSVKYSVFVPMLIKAMQEQQEIINDLKARIETLENQ